MRLIACLLCTLALAGRAHAAPFVIDDVNGDAAPTPLGVFLVGSIGWLYTPDVSYDLIGVQTRFGPFEETPGLRSEVTLEIYTGVPRDGGTLLRSTTFLSAPDTFTGGLFAPLPLTAGEDYFVGLRNVQFLAPNTTDDPGAETLPRYLNYLAAFPGDEDPGGPSAPILRFLADDGVAVPEPSTLALLIIGAIAVLSLQSGRTWWRAG